MTAVLEKARYSNDQINCTCGTLFPVYLETRLSDQAYDNSCYDSEITDEELCVCPNCNTEYILEITVEKTIETTWTQLKALGQFISSPVGEKCNITALLNKWIGDRVFTFDKEEDEEISFPDGVFRTGNKEYTVQDSVVVNFWSIPDENQLLLFQEVA
jgi:hypothetical protein